MAALVIVVALLLVGVSAPAIPAADIEPDRPEVTESAKLVPRGAVQLESGVAWLRERQAGVASERTFQIEADLRIGVAHDVELNLGWEPFVRVRGPRDDTGSGDVTVGIRYRFLEGADDQPWPPHLALKAFARVPTSDEPLASGRPDFGGLILGSFALPIDFELEVNLGAAAIGVNRPNGYLAQGFATASLKRDLTPSLFGFLEFLFNTRTERDGREHFAVNVGLVYRVTGRVAIDAGIQTSLAGRGPDYVARTGLSVLWR
jgi:Putative MetA-pathway of phenol degradation